MAEAAPREAANGHLGAARADGPGAGGGRSARCAGSVCWEYGAGLGTVPCRWLPDLNCAENGTIAPHRCISKPIEQAPLNNSDMVATA